MAEEAGENLDQSSAARELRRKRNSAFSIRVGISAEDKVYETISRRDGLYSVSLNKIIRINLPDDIDPQLLHENAPIAQTLIVEKGSRNPIVARTILQAEDFSRFFPRKEQYKKVQDIAWEVMFSLLALDRISGSIEASVEAKKSEIEKEFPLYTDGESPPPPPIIEDLEIQFRSAVLIANHALNSISEIFPAFFEMKFKRGAFDRLLNWSIQTFGENDILTMMLRSDHRWINCWGEVRNALEHPKDDYFVVINNFRILPNRQIQEPTWQLKHPSLDLFRPQNLLYGLKLHETNILGLFENLLVVLVEKVSSLPFPITLIDKAESDRDPDCPKRYDLQILPTEFGKNS
jgi:hypothetical protein